MIISICFILLFTLLFFTFCYCNSDLELVPISKNTLSLAILFSFVGFLVMCVISVIVWNNYVQLQAKTEVTIEQCRTENKQISKDFADMIAISNKYSDASEQIDSSVPSIIGIKLTLYKDDDNVKAELKQYYQNRKTIRECKKQDSKLRYYRKLLAIK